MGRGRESPARPEGDHGGADGRSEALIVVLSPAKDRLLLGALLVTGAVASAQPAKPLRELTTDRPDRTESPITVDKGHFQFEIELANAATPPQSTSFRRWGFCAVNSKLGVGEHTDIQVVFQAHERTKTAFGTVTRNAPDVTFRLKHNLRGNDEGRTAFALMPFATVPRGGGSVEFGLIVPWSRELSDAWSVGAMSEVDVSSANDVTLVNSVTFGRSLSKTLGAYFEVASELPGLAPKEMASTFDLGLTRSVGPNIQLDAGVNVGLDGRAEGLRLFAGVSRRY